MQRARARRPGHASAIVVARRRIIELQRQIAALEVRCRHAHCDLRESSVRLRGLREAVAALRVLKRPIAERWDRLERLIQETIDAVPRE